MCGGRGGTPPSPLFPPPITLLEIYSFCSYPNNPSGVKRSPLVKNPDHVIMDMVYYWPMYTDIETKVDHPIMVFSRYFCLPEPQIEVLSRSYLFSWELISLLLCRIFCTQTPDIIGKKGENEGDYYSLILKPFST